MGNYPASTPPPQLQTYRDAFNFFPKVLCINLSLNYKLPTLEKGLKLQQNRANQAPKRYKKTKKHQTLVEEATLTT